MTDIDTQAANIFYREVRNFAVTVKPWIPAIRHQVLPDEIWDMSLVSQRVYGRRTEFLAVLASSGLSGFDEPLPQGILIMPTDAQLYQIKRRAGFESIPDYRDGGKPVWAD